jgi:betaine reductase
MCSGCVAPIYAAGTNSIILFKALRKEKLMAILNGKKVIVIGDRDGIPGPAIAECAESAGAEVVFSSTECFV